MGENFRVDKGLGFGNMGSISMKKNPNTKNEERDKRIYAMYKKGAYTYRGLGKLFRLSHPRVIAIVSKQEMKEELKEIEKETKERKVLSDAHRATRKAIKERVIKKPKLCQKRGKARHLIAHHEDYSKPLKITWLCVSCHRRRHIEIGNKNQKPAR